MVYEIQFVGLSNVEQAIREAGLQLPQGASASVLDNKAFNCVGQPPARPMGSRVTYAAGARGPTPNPTEQQPESMTVQFSPILPDTSDIRVIRYYLPAKGAAFLETAARAYARAPWLGVMFRSRVYLRRIFEENSSDRAGVDAKTSVSSVDGYEVLYTHAGHTGDGYQLMFDVFSKAPTKVENYGSLSQLYPVT